MENVRNESLILKSILRNQVLILNYQIIMEPIKMIPIPLLILPSGFLFLNPTNNAA